MAARSSVPVIASGGIGCMADCSPFFRSNHSECVVIVGRALRRSC